MSSLEGLYGEVRCTGTTCAVGPRLVDAVLSSPEAVLAEGTSFAVARRDGRAVGLEARGVDEGGLAWRLGLREGDVIVQVGGMAVRSEAEVMAAAAWAMETEKVVVVIVREGVRIERVIVRG